MLSQIARGLSLRLAGLIGTTSSRRSRRDPVLAANTSYQGFPRLSALLARDRFLPRQFENLGDRLVYSNGILVLAGLAILLIWSFHGQRNSLLQLYVVGVFTAFTLARPA